MTSPAKIRKPMFIWTIVVRDFVEAVKRMHDPAKCFEPMCEHCEAIRLIETEIDDAEDDHP